jgi:hypothetical protein
MDLGFDITPLNIGALNSQISSAGAGGGGEGGNRIKMDLHTVISFFLLPPWCAAKGQLAKEIWECYDLPARQGQKWSRHVAWCTYESLEPGITARDPRGKRLAGDGVGRWGEVCREDDALEVVLYQRYG